MKRWLPQLVLALLTLGVPAAGLAQGLIRDKPDRHDIPYRPSPTRAAVTIVNLEKEMPSVWDQGSCGCCVWNAVGAMFEYERQHSGYKDVWTPSRMFGYYLTRVQEGTERSDAGCSMRDAMQVLATNGVCPQSSWGYLIRKLRDKPNAQAYADALKHKSTGFRSLTLDRDPASGYVNYLLQPMKDCLAAHHPFCIAMVLYAHFLTQNGVMVTPPKDLWGRLYDPHAVLVVGYDDARQAFRIRNSWGGRWCEGGYAWVRYTDIVNPQLFFDGWMIEGASG